MMLSRFYYPFKPFFLLLCLISLVLVSCGSDGSVVLSPGDATAAATTPESMVAQINGQGITVSEFEAELARHQSAMTKIGSQVSVEESSRRVLDDLIDQTLLAQGAQELGYSIDETALQTREDDLISAVGGSEAWTAWLTENGYSEETFQRSLERAIEAGWMSDQIIASVSDTADQVHAQKIMSSDPEEAQAIWEGLNSGEDFKDFVDPVTLGELGWFPRGYLPEPAIEEAAFSLQPGQYSNVIETEVGYYIVMVIDRDAHRLLSPDALLALQGHALVEWLTTRREQGTIILTP